jgi:hypothetical protein
VHYVACLFYQTHIFGRLHWNGHCVNVFRVGDRLLEAAQQPNVWVGKNNDTVFGNMGYGSVIGPGCFCNNSVILRLCCSILDKKNSPYNRPRRPRGGVEL